MGFKWSYPGQERDEVSDADETPAPAPAPAAAPMAWHDDDGHKLRRIPDAYRNEQVSSLGQRGGRLDVLNALYGPHAENPGADFTGVNVHYNDADEQAAARLRFKDGRLRTADRQNLDTTEASGAGTYFDLGAGKHIGVMTEEGHLRATDAWASHRESPDHPEARPGSRKARQHQLTMMNHSSLAAEDDGAGELEARPVRWAGEIEAQDGQAISVSDVSGHYHTDSEMMYQMADKTHRHGADEKLTMKYLPKTPRKDGRNPSPMTGNHYRDRWLRAGVDEVLSHGADPQAETKMRARRHEMRGGIRSAVVARDARRAQGEMRMGGQIVDESPELLDPRVLAPEQGHEVPNPVEPGLRRRLAGMLFDKLF